MYDVPFGKFNRGITLECTILLRELLKSSLAQSELLFFFVKLENTLVLSNLAGFLELYADSQRIRFELTSDDPFHYRLVSPNHEEKFPAEPLIMCKSSRLRDERGDPRERRVADVTTKAPMS